MKTANERLAEARIALGFDRKAEFAEHVGIERSTYDKMEKGPHKPSADNLERIVMRCPHLNLTWLLTGAGQMLLDASGATAPAPAPVADYTTAAGTIDAAVNVVLREQIADLRATVAFLKEELGKFGSSLEAAWQSGNPRAPKQGARRELLAA